MLLDAPVILSHSKAVLDAHAQSSDFCKLTWLKLSGTLCCGPQVLVLDFALLALDFYVG